MPETEPGGTPNASLALGYIIGALHGVKEPYLQVSEIRTEQGEFILELVGVEGGDRVCVTVREIVE